MWTRSLKNAGPWWASRVNSSPHAANHSVFTMYPVWTPRWTQITSIQSLCKNGSEWDHMNAPSGSSDHIKTVLIIRSCASTAPSVPSCGGFFFNYPTSKDPRLQTADRPRSIEKARTHTKKEGPKPFTQSHSVGQCETPGPLLHLQNKSTLFSSCYHSTVSHLIRDRSRENVHYLIKNKSTGPSVWKINCNTIKSWSCATADN